MVSFADYVREAISTVNDKGLKSAVDEAAQQAKETAEKAKEVVVQK